MLDKNKRIAQEYFQNTIRVLTGMAEDHLKSLLVVSDGQHGSGNNSKQLYSPYGLLLSAHDSEISGEIDKQKVHEFLSIACHSLVNIIDT